MNNPPPPIYLRLLLGLFALFVPFSGAQAQTDGSFRFQVGRTYASPGTFLNPIGVNTFYVGTLAEPIQYSQGNSLIDDGLWVAIPSAATSPGQGVTFGLNYAGLANGTNYNWQYYQIVANDGRHDGKLTYFRDDESFWNPLVLPLDPSRCDSYNFLDQINPDNPNVTPTVTNGTGGQQANQPNALYTQNYVFQSSEGLELTVSSGYVGVAPTLPNNTLIPAYSHWFFWVSGGGEYSIDASAFKVVPPPQGVITSSVSQVLSGSDRAPAGGTDVTKTTITWNLQ